MKNKKLYIIFAIVVVVAAAAFVGGRLLNGQAGPMRMFMMGGDRMAVSISLERAPELPTTEPETTGTFVERKDNTIILQTFSMKSGGGGVIVGSADDASDAPKVEVVITNETIIYRDATEFSGPRPSSGENVTIRQVVEEGTLDDLT